MHAFTSHPASTPLGYLSWAEQGAARVGEWWERVQSAWTQISTKRSIAIGWGRGKNTPIITYGPALADKIGIVFETILTKIPQG